ncbi:MAG: 16S rRNA (guanine(966)-N(2))-methyltransferase RsmD [Thermodesulfobacteriota bacterium]|nr:16S rRNA (guanine(966)-N(2))-methyltransferase RsmD [Thermodesulfobacteriota bacterium]
MYKRLNIMRITGGGARGRKLSFIKTINIRPTSDMVRSSIFNILGQTLTGFSVLDLFAGTGSLGIESFSRGAKKAVFVDRSSKAISLIRKNLAICGYEELSKTFKRHLPDGLNHLKCEGSNKFDIIFIDPPYGKGYIKPTIDKLFENNLFHENSTVVVESSINDSKPLPAYIQNLQLKLSRSYGMTLIGIYTHNEKT